MTWVGKTLAIVVFLMSLAWMWFTAADYSARVNWRNAQVAWQKAYNEAVEARKSEYSRHQAEQEAQYKLIDSYQKEKLALRGELDTLAKANKDNKAELDRLITAAATADQQIIKLQTDKDAMIKELNVVRDRNNKLEIDRQELTITREQARRDELAAKNEARLQTKIAEDNARRVDDLTALINEYKATGGRPGGAVARALDKSAPPVPENLRGTVTHYDRATAPDLVEISLGLDAGLTFGSRLDIYRLEGGGKHLGTLVVTNVRAKSAVARFQPANNLPIARLRPDELPKVGDTVSPLGGPGGGGAAALR
jgi:hypothetical protein